MYPVNLKMEGVSCLIIGGGHVSLRKVKKLVDQQAHVTVLAPEICKELMALWQEKRISWKKAFYEAGDAKGYHFVVTASGSRKVAEMVRQESLDFPELGNCFLPAAFETGGIRFTVSTNGRSPAMAKYVKNWLAGQIPPSFGVWLDRVGDIRLELKEKLKDSHAREDFWHTVFSDRIMDLVLSGKLDEAEECVRHATGCIGIKP